MQTYPAEICYFICSGEDHLSRQQQTIIAIKRTSRFCGKDQGMPPDCF
jgi:hypothetical protein